LPPKKNLNKEKRVQFFSNKAPPHKEKQSQNQYFAVAQTKLKLFLGWEKMSFLWGYGRESKKKEAVLGCRFLIIIRWYI